VRCGAISLRRGQRYDDDDDDDDDDEKEADDYDETVPVTTSREAH